MIRRALCDGIKKLVTQAFGSQLRRNMSSGVVATAVNILLLVVSIPLYLHYLGYEKYGLWLILATVLGFAQLGMLGIRQAVMKLVAEEYGRDNLVGVQSYVVMALTILAVTGTVTLLAILFFKGQVINLLRLSGGNAELVSRLLPYIGLLSIYVFFVHTLTATISGLGRMDLANYTQAAGRFVAISVSVLLLCFDYGVESLLIGNTLSYVVLHIVSLVFIRYQAEVRFLRLDNWDWQRLKKLLTFGSGVFGGSLVSILLDPFNKMMLSRYAGVASVPVYDIAFRGSMQIRTVLEAGLRALMPEISRIGANMNSQARIRIASINRKAVKLILTGGVLLYAIVFIFAAVLLRAWLRDSFVDVLPRAFRIMLIASFVSLLAVPAFYTHMGQGRVRHCFISQSIQSFINVVILLTYAKFAPGLISSHIFYALGAGMCGSTIYLVWQFRRSNMAVTKAVQPKTRTTPSGANILDGLNEVTQ